MIKIIIENNTPHKNSFIFSFVDSLLEEYYAGKYKKKNNFLWLNIESESYNIGCYLIVNEKSLRFNFIDFS